MSFDCSEFGRRLLLPPSIAAKTPDDALLVGTGGLVDCCPRIAAATVPSGPIARWLLIASLVLLPIRRLLTVRVSDYLLFLI